MSDEPPQISILDARLAEIDQRLRRIQTGLVTETGPEPPAPQAAVPSRAELPPRVEVPEPGSSVVVAELRQLAVTQEGLLASMRQALSALEFVLGQASAVAAGSEARSPGGARPSAPGRSNASVTVTAGPFPSTEAVRGFAGALSGLPGVGEVEVRGYEGGDRAIVDVRLGEPTS